MFFEPARRDRAALPFDPFKAIVAPRPIGWIGSISREGRVNLAPYSYFNAVSGRPPVVMFSSEGRKDSVVNVEETGAFTCSLATLDLMGPMSVTSAPLARGEDEFAAAGLTPSPSRLVAPPFVAEAPAALECRLIRVLRMTDAGGRELDIWTVFGEVVGVHLREEFVEAGRFRLDRAGALARCGYDDYAVVDRLFSLERPGGGAAVR